MKKQIIIALLTIVTFASGSVYAIDSTSSATSDMQDKIKTLVQENISTTEAKLKEKVDLQTLVGYVGIVKTIGSDNLTVDTQGILLQVSSNAKTVYTKNGVTVKLTSLAIGDQVIVIGTSVKDDIVQAKKVTVIKEDTSDQVITTAVVAKVTAVDTKKKIITLNINGTDQTLTLSKKSTVKLEDLSADQTILGIVKLYQGKLSISRAKVL
ncbi:MAG TPA: hypothetical protein PLI45_00520 [Candidatus Woesebacteria bacterium]|nr:hypothetical protein [Candidatus Woesebacteria bacterium]